MSIFRKKPIEAYQQEAKNNDLNRVLTRWGLTSLGIGAIIGGGIFTLTGIAANEHAGPALALAFIIASVACSFSAICYAEFASVFPVGGSAYSYAYGTIGEFFAWFIGWNLILEYMLSAALVAVAWSGYFNKLLHLINIHIPEQWVNDPATYGGPAFNLLAFLVTGVITGILIKGIKETASANNFIVVLKISVVLFVIIAGAFYVNPANWDPFIPDEIVDAAGCVHYGYGGVLTAATIAFLAYIGFDAVSTQAGEAINPKKDIPFAIIASLVICTILYVAVSLVLTGMVKYDQLDMKAPVASAFSSQGLTWAVYLVTIAASAGLMSVMLVVMMAQTRIFLSMAKDGLLPKGIFGTLHPKFKTPWKSTFLVGFIIAVVSGLTPIENISEMISMGTLVAFSMVCVAVLVLRVKEPLLERPYKTPWIWVVAPLGIGFNIFLMTHVRENTMTFFTIWGTLGILIYFLYSRRHSNLNNS